jgi:hypothetical protein
MKVYAEFIEENNIKYRKTTILQFGDSWDLIGSAVLKNPGSAIPKNQVNDEIFQNIQGINSRFDKKIWFEFNNDSTMGYLEKVFNGFYIGEKRSLNGIILLFNLYYIKDQNIGNARRLASNNSSANLFPIAEEVIPYFNNKPVFLGWRWEYREYNEIFAQKIFEFVKNSEFMYLEKDMIDNHFYHPGYIQIRRGNENIQKTLKAFYGLLD